MTSVTQTELHNRYAGIVGQPWEKVLSDYPEIRGNN
jgi:hypothetical protein